MKNKQVEEHVFEAIQELHKDQWESISNDAKNVAIMPIVTETKERSSYGWKLVFTTAAILLFALGAFLFQARSTDVVDAVIYLDVNPSVEIEVNNKDTVMQVLPINEDGKQIIGNMDFKNSSLEVTVNALIGSMVRNGYLSEFKNSVLISVDAKDANRANGLEDRLTNEINTILLDSQLEGAILSQSLTDDQALKDKAEAYHISSGKAKLIEDITNTSYHEFEELTDLSINDLNLIYKNKTEMKSQGEASQKGYIGEEKAIDSALGYYHINRNDITLKEVDLDYEKGTMVYEVEFYYNGQEYDVDVNAITGEVVKVDMDNHERKETTQVSPPNATVAPTTSNITISMDEAIDIALKHAGLNRNGIYDLDAELERGIYEVEFKASNYEYEYDIDASSGEIKQNKKEIDD